MIGHMVNIKRFSKAHGFGPQLGVLLWNVVEPSRYGLLMEVGQGKQVISTSSPNPSSLPLSCYPGVILHSNTTFSLLKLLLQVLCHSDENVTRKNSVVRAERTAEDSLVELQEGT